MGLSADFDDRQTHLEAEQDQYVPYEYQTENNDSWAGALPVKQGLYDPSLEKDACGVGFACHIKGKPSHKIVSDGAFSSTLQSSSMVNSSQRATFCAT